MATPIWVPNTLLTVPAALRYLDANGDPVTSLYPLDYLILLGQDLALISGTTSQLSTNWQNQASQITALQAAVATIPPTYTTPEIPPFCLLPVSGTTAPIDQLLEILAEDWCNYINVTGSGSALATAITWQCLNLNSSPSFGTPGTSMSAITGWKNSPTTVADSLTNSWLTICDARAGITRALAGITPTCSQVIVDTQVVSNTPLTFLFYFSGYTFIPTSFIDTGSTIEITDSAGNIYLTGVDIVDQSTDTNPFSIFASGSTLSPTSTTYTITLNSRVASSSLGLTCEKTIVIPDFENPDYPPIPSGSGTECCPDIGNFSATVVSGSTSLTLISSLSYTPRFGTYIPKDFFSGAQLVVGGATPYISYTLGGGVLHFLPTATTGTFDIDFIFYR